METRTVYTYYITLEKTNKKKTPNFNLNTVINVLCSLKNKLIL